MIQNYSVHTNNIQEGIKDIQDKVKESLVRIVRDTELSISE
jgi:hypothetical protein